MLFNSIDFAIFLPIVFVLYWFVANKSLRLQNGLLVISSYLFYGWWDWRFLSLIIFSSVVDYWIGRLLIDTDNQIKRKTLLWISIIINLGLLGFFKYYNFFLDNVITAFSFFGVGISGRSLNIILPVGISFYTFQTLSYTIDNYKGKIKPTKDFIAFSAFVSFFPQLVAGPIERASNLLPQFYGKREFDYKKAADGMRQILWGLFKKIVIADNCAEYANQIFNNSIDMNGSTLALGAIFFSFQIYGDFSGYSDIAIGTSRLFGFKLKQNFAFPYFSRNIAEFWRRWHISLSTWFRDYLYIPLGGSRGGTWSKIRNTFIIFIVSGFWHGANWTFIFWGLINAVLFIPLLLLNKNKENTVVIVRANYFAKIRDFIRILFTFSLTTIAWIFFRSENIGHAFEYVSEMLSSSFFQVPVFRSGKPEVVITICLLLLFVIIEWFGRYNLHALENLFGIKPRVGRWLTYMAIIILILFFQGQGQEFIYFQF
jgi:alginate O-acetyltransferase complex protein AlgI